MKKMIKFLLFPFITFNKHLRKFEPKSMKGIVLRIIYFSIKDLILALGRLINLRNRKEWHINKAKKIAYLNMPKGACTSIKNSLYDKNISMDIHLLRGQQSLTMEQQHFFKFTFVRNPFERVCSAWLDKLTKETSRGFSYLYGSLFYFDMPFSKFVSYVSVIPDRYSEPHFLSQYAICYDEKNKCMVDFVGKFEDLKIEYEKLVKNYGIKPLTHENKIKDSDYRDFYTLDLVEKVAKRYAKDIKTFGYEKEYQELKNYINTKKSTMNFNDE